ncbi:MAG: hypothetical protein RL469_1139 [Pseudomonadota bacterium]
MKHPFLRIATLLSLWIATPLWAADAAKSTCVTATDADVAALFDKWNLTLTTLDSAKVADLYWPDGVLLPTVSNQPRTNTALIKDYFDHFLEKHPRGRIDERHVHHSCNLSVDMGLYTFFLLDKNGKPQEVNARYTYVYTYRNGTWKIQHHHSSAMPEPMSATPAAAPAHATLPPASSPHASTAPAPAPSPAPVAAADSAPGETPAVAEATPEENAKPVLRARLQRTPPMRHISEFVSKESLDAIGADTVSVKVCATAQDPKARSFDVSDPSPKSEANEAALAWARGSNWLLQNPNGEAFPICTHVIARFGG